MALLLADVCGLCCKGPRDVMLILKLQSCFDARSARVGEPIRLAMVRGNGRDVNSIEKTWFPAGL